MWRTCYHKKKQEKQIYQGKGIKVRKEKRHPRNPQLTKISILFFCKQERSFSLASRCQMCQRKVVNTKNSRIIKLNEGPTQIY